VRMPTPEGSGMEVLIPACRKWTTLLLGAYLFTAPWIFGISEAEASSVNAWIVVAVPDTYE
jgi:SPW repeat-containing protein